MDCADTSVISNGTKNTKTKQNRYSEFHQKSYTDLLQMIGSLKVSIFDLEFFPVFSRFFPVFTFCHEVSMLVKTFLNERISENWSRNGKYFDLVNFIVQCDIFSKLCGFEQFHTVGKHYYECENSQFQTWKKLA